MKGKGSPRDLTGLKFGRLTAQWPVGKVPAGKSFRIAWLFLCDCGEIKILDGWAAVSGNTRSCGCLFRDSRKTINKTHGLSRNPVTAKSSTARAWRLYYRYGVTDDWYKQKLIEQNHFCAVCKKPFGDELPVVDHDNNCCPFEKKKGCGKCARGLLHMKCNAALGIFGDSKEILQNAILYLEGFSRANS